jgi:glycosyltransferase involved in cell wall biosynthesis
MPPLVSVLTTVYNREPYLAACIESVLIQSMDDLELIIVDDCSTDGSYSVAERYLSDPRVHLYRNDKNLGDYLNRNRAASLAKGKYLKYVDGDDLIYPHCLEVMTEGMAEYPTAAYGICRQINGLVPPAPLDPKGAYLQHYLGNGLFDAGPLDAILRRDAFIEMGGFAPQPYTGDTEFFLRIGAKWPVVILTTGLAWWRHHDEQESVLETRSNDLVMEVLLRRAAYSCAALGAIGCPLSPGDTWKICGNDARRLLRIAMSQASRGDFKWFWKALKQALDYAGLSLQANKILTEADQTIVQPHGQRELHQHAPSIADIVHKAKLASKARNQSGAPSVSVLIPASQAEGTIERAILSVLEQRFENWELVIVDDGSTDRTFEIAESYSWDQRIRCYRNSGHAGKWRTHNRCAELAHGEFIKFLDPSDCLFPQCLTHLVELMRMNPECAMGFTGADVNHIGGTRLDPDFVFRQEFLMHSIFHLGPTSLLYVRARFLSAGGYDPGVEQSCGNLGLRLAMRFPLLLVYGGLVYIDSPPLPHLDRCLCGESAWLQDMIQALPDALLSITEKSAVLAGLCGKGERPWLPREIRSRPYREGTVLNWPAFRALASVSFLPTNDMQSK